MAYDKLSRLYRDFAQGNLMLDDYLCQLKRQDPQNPLLALEQIERPYQTEITKLYRIARTICPQTTISLRRNRLSKALTAELYTHHPACPEMHIISQFWIPRTEEYLLIIADSHTHPDDCEYNTYHELSDTLEHRLPLKEPLKRAVLRVRPGIEDKINCGTVKIAQ